MSTEPATSAKEHCHLVVEKVLTGLGIRSGHTVLDNGSIALVHHLNEFGFGDEPARGWDRVLADLKVLLAVQQHHGVEVGHERVKAEGCLGVEGRDHAETGQNLEVLGSLAGDVDVRTQSQEYQSQVENDLQDVAQVRPLRADTEIVKHHITFSVLEFGTVALFLQSVLNCVEVLVSATLEVE